jgi:hypothetical protein
MDGSAQPEPVDAEIVDDDLLYAEETVDGEPVLDDDAPDLAPARRVADALAPAASPAVQAVAAAATGFVAGAATLALARRRSGRKLARSPGRRRPADALPIVGTRSFLIDIHMLRPD